MISWALVSFAWISLFYYEGIIGLSSWNELRKKRWFAGAVSLRDTICKGDYNNSVFTLLLQSFMSEQSPHVEMRVSVRVRMASRGTSEFSGFGDVAVARLTGSSLSPVSIPLVKEINENTKYKNSNETFSPMSRMLMEEQRNLIGSSYRMKMLVLWHTRRRIQLAEPDKGGDKMNSLYQVSLISRRIPRRNGSAPIYRIWWICQCLCIMLSGNR